MRKIFQKQKKYLFLPYNFTQHKLFVRILQEFFQPKIFRWYCIFYNKKAFLVLVSPKGRSARSICLITQTSCPTFSTLTKILWWPLPSPLVSYAHVFQMQSRTSTLFGCSKTCPYSLIMKEAMSFSPLLKPCLLSG